VVFLYVVLRDFALVDLSLFGQEIHGVGLLKERIAFVFLVAEDAAYGGNSPFVLAAGSWNTIVGQLLCDAVVAHALQEHGVNALHDDCLFSVDHQIPIRATAVTITFERKGRSFDRLLLAPISLSAMVAAKLSGAILFGLFNAFVPVLFASFFIDLAGINWGAVLLAVFLIAVTSTLLGLMIAVSSKEVFEAQTFSNFFRFPMLFLCGLFLPISSLPIFLRPISYLLPLTYGTDLLSGAINGAGTLPPGLCVLLLLAFAVGLFAFCQCNIRRKWIL